MVRVGSLVEETSYQAVVRLAAHEPWELYDFFGRQAGAGQDRGRIQAAFSDELEEHREILGRNRVSSLSDLIDSTAHERILPETDGAPARRPLALGAVWCEVGRIGSPPARSRKLEAVDGRNRRFRPDEPVFNLPIPQLFWFG
jgi:hypothetical protein